MQDPFRAFVLGLGILLGLVEGGATPSLAARIFRDAQSVRVSAEISNGISKPVRELVAAGNRVCFELEVERDGRLLRAARRSLEKTPAGTWTILRSEDGRVFETESEEAAYILLSRWDSVVVEDIAPYASLAKDDHMRILIRASVLVNDAPWEDSRLLWNYQRPQRVLKIRSLTEVPY